MERYVKLFAVMALLCLVSALPVDELQQQQEQEQIENVNEPQVDLLAADSSPITDSESVSSDELTRDKRHYRHYGGFGGFGGYGGYGGYGYPGGFGGYGGYPYGNL